MTINPERTPSSQPLSPIELSLETALLIDPEQGNIDELETFLTLQAVLLKKVEQLIEDDVDQEYVTSLERLLTTTSQHFARTVTTEDTPQDKATYATELILQALKELDALFRRYGQAMTGEPSESLRTSLTAQLSQILKDKNAQEIFETLENSYGGVFNSIINRLLS